MQGFALHPVGSCRQHDLWDLIRRQSGHSTLPFEAVKDGYAVAVGDKSLTVSGVCFYDLADGI
jgi:hypothetical protein